MKLKSLKFSESITKSWNVEFQKLHPNINLIVGRNSSGKTRVINIINSLANLMCTIKKPLYDSGKWNIIFEDEGTTNEYHLEIDDKKVVSEQYVMNGDTVLKREKTGKGEILAQEAKLKNMAFQVAPDHIASFYKRDAIQHPFLEKLYNWGYYLRTYSFGSDLGRSNVTILNEESSVNPKNQNDAVSILKFGKQKFGDSFISAIIEDMKSIDFFIDKIELAPFDRLLINFIDGTPMVISIKEKGIEKSISQADISQGMFRVLSLLIHLHYFLFSKMSGNILIDDIGEGLDYHRSTRLIKLIMNKSQKHSNIQFIMTTNNEKIMNIVPLKYWCIIERKGEDVKVYNKENSPAVFEEFEFTGLNNADFYTSDFYKGEYISPSTCEEERSFD